MTRPVPFQFGRDFREKNAPESDPALNLSQGELDRMMAKAEEAGFARGLSAGRDTSIQSQTARIAESCESIGRHVGQGLDMLDRRNQQCEADAIELAMLVAQKLGGTALSHFPLAEIEAAVVECFTETRNTPHVVVRVAADLMEDIETRLTAIASEKGFSGRLIVLGEPDIEPGDARVEWADGGIVRDRAALLSAIREATERHLRTVPNPGERS